MKFFGVFCVFLFYISYVQSYRILGLFPYPGKSHMDVILPLMKQLATKGHHVTVVSHFPLKNPHIRYKDLSLNGTLPLRFELEEPNNFQAIKSRIMTSYIDPFMMDGVLSEFCRTAYESNAVKELLASDESFDVVIAEMFFSDCIQALNKKFKTPLVEIITSIMVPWSAAKFGTPDNPSYIPTLYLGYSDKMNFFERTENFVVSTLHKFWFSQRQKKDDQIVSDYLKGNVESVSKFATNESLLLVNSHFSLSLARPLTPNVVEVGGLHIGKAKLLPENIEKFINESTHGVIYFSLGSMIKGHTFPQEKRQEFLKAFARLPQRVLWKWENETMPGKPDNVMIQKWMPQFDILSHPNVKAFISHGGLLGTTEAVHCGVPMLVMPQYGDQHTNAKAIEVNGGGVILYLRDATEEKVYQGLKTILDPEFREKAQALSERFRDRPMSPMDTAIYWVEYVARHKGAPHMRTAAVDMPLYQYLLLDVLAFLAAIAIILLYITYKFSRLIFRVIFPKKKMKQS